MSSRMNQLQEQLMDAERVLINPLNQSTSKQQYTFPKAERWNRCKTHHQNYHFYDIPSTKSRIATTIGSSKRALLAQHDALPAPGQYSYACEGEFGGLGKRRNRGFGFGLGRSEMKINSFLNLRSDIPPPNAYNPHSAAAQREYTFSREQKFRAGRVEQSKVGPGSYKVSSSLDENGQILSTQHRNASPKLLETKVESRKKTLQMAPPIYYPMTTAKGERLNLVGVNRGFRIGNSKRAAITSGEVPGPGRYKMFSEFPAKAKK